MSNYNESNELVEFDKKKMMKLVNQDILIERMWLNLGADVRALRIVFNSEVLGDSIMEGIYRKL